MGGNEKENKAYAEEYKFLKKKKEPVKKTHHHVKAAPLPLTVDAEIFCKYSKSSMIFHDLWHCQ